MASLQDLLRSSPRIQGVIRHPSSEFHCKVRKHCKTSFNTCFDCFLSCMMLESLGSIMTHEPFPPWRERPDTLLSERRRVDDAHGQRGEVETEELPGMLGNSGEAEHGKPEARGHQRVIEERHAVHYSWRAPSMRLPARPTAASARSTNACTPR